MVATISDPNTANVGWTIVAERVGFEPDRTL
jgi:hypothetical protein